MNISTWTGDFTWDEVEKLGETYEFYVLWNRVLITSDVNIVKVRSSTVNCVFYQVISYILRLFSQTTSGTMSKVPFTASLRVHVHQKLYRPTVRSIYEVCSGHWCLQLRW